MQGSLVWQAPSHQFSPVIPLTLMTTFFLIRTPLNFFLVGAAATASWDFCFCFFSSFSLRFASSCFSSATQKRGEKVASKTCMLLQGTACSTAGHSPLTLHCRLKVALPRMLIVLLRHLLP